MSGLNIRLPRAGVRFDSANEDATRREIELAFQRLPESAVSGLARRRDVVWTTASLAANAEEQGAIAMGAKTQVLLILETNRACRLRLYAAESARTTDHLRSLSVDPKAGIGVLAEFIWLDTHTKLVSPTVDLYNADDVATDAIYYTVQNLSGSAGTITLTFTVLTLEADEHDGVSVAPGSTPKATSTVTGTVKTDVDEADPVVYTAASVDDLLDDKSDTSHTHTNLPSDDEKDALVGTDGTPSSANPYVTDSDPRLAGSAGAIALISEVVTTASQASVTFSSISAAYRDLIIKVRGRGTTAAVSVTVRVRFNADTGNNYHTANHNRFGSGQTLNTSGIILADIPAATSTASHQITVSGDVGNYRGTTFFKPVSCLSGGFANGVVYSDLRAGTWNSTTAITSIEIAVTAGGFVDGSVVSLYGVL